MGSPYIPCADSAPGWAITQPHQYASQGTGGFVRGRTEDWPVCLGKRLGLAEGYFLATIKRAGQALEARMLIDRIFDDREGDD